MQRQRVVPNTVTRGALLQAPPLSPSRPPLSSAFGGLLRLTLRWGRARRAGALCHPRRSS